MSTTVLSEGIHTGEHMVSEAQGYRSREIGVITGAAKLTPATVLGQVLTAAASAGATVGTGNGVMGAITVSALAQAGVYTLKITKAAANAGDFEVIDPQGDVGGVGTVGVVFTGGGLNFTLADGATDFVVGDSIPITVAAGSKKYKILAPAAVDGTQIAAAVLYATADTTSADVQQTIHVRDCEVNGLVLTWPAGITDQQKSTAIAQLAANHVIVRS